jgi:hypothetical protein
MATTGCFRKRRGHLFLEYEAEDLASFLQMALLNGWGGYVLPQANYANAFFSHDEYISFFAERAENLAEVREAFKIESSRTDTHEVG